MDLKEPRKKRQCTIESQQPFPIFIESEIGISIENWVPIICTGLFNGFGVIVKTPAEISALHNMGNFGKGSNSRSRPYIMRNHSELPRFLKKRQYLHRKKWMNRIDCSKNRSKRLSKSSHSDLLDDIMKLNSTIDSVESVCKTKISDSNHFVKKSEIIDVLSSDEENLALKNSETLDLTQPSTSGNDAPIVINIESAKSMTDEVFQPIRNDQSESIEDIKTIHDLNFPSNSVIVLPDSDSEKDDYFKDLKPKLYVDQSNLEEHLVLTLQEAYFLAYGLGCLQILDENEKPLDLDTTWQLFYKSQPDFCRKYIVYHYYRSKGWIVKPGIKFGGDFLLYKEGQPFYHASYIVLVEVVETHDSAKQSWHSKYDWKNILGTIRMAGTAVKEVIIARVIVPTGESLDMLCKNIDDLKKIKVLEVLLRRWLSKQERLDWDRDGK